MDSEEVLEVIVGTYEDCIIGYKLEKATNGFEFKQSFADRAHCGSVRAVASSSKFLASGSTDESIKLFNLKTRVEHGSLMQHEGSISDLKFYKNAFLFSGADDNCICIWRTSTWNCEKILKGHKGGITSLSIHPSGRLALSVSKDRSLKTWNLIKGRCAYTTNIKAVADIVLWSPDGAQYAVVINSKLDIYSVELAGVINTIDFKKRIISAVFITNKHVAIGGEDTSIEIHNVSEQSRLCEFEAHDNRIKGLCITPYPGNDQSSLLLSASSDGFIKAWRLSLNQLQNTPECIATVDTSCRVTCMTIAVLPQTKRKCETSDTELITDEESIEVVEENSAKKINTTGKKTKKKMKLQG